MRAAVNEWRIAAQPVIPRRRTAHMEKRGAGSAGSDAASGDDMNDVDDTAPENVSTTRPKRLVSYVDDIPSTRSR